MIHKIIHNLSHLWNAIILLSNFTHKFIVLLFMNGAHFLNHYNQFCLLLDWLTNDLTLKSDIWQMRDKTDGSWFIYSLMCWLLKLKCVILVPNNRTAKIVSQSSSKPYEHCPLGYGSDNRIKYFNTEKLHSSSLKVKYVISATLVAHSGITKIMHFFKQPCKRPFYVLCLP